MHLPVAKSGPIRLFALFALVAAIAVFLYSSVGTTHAIPYEPTVDFSYCNGLSVTFPDSKASTDDDLKGANTAPGSCTDPATIPADTDDVDTTVEFFVASGMSNFGSSVVTNTAGTRSDVTVGDKVGGFRSDIRLGLLNGPCATDLVAEFVLYDSVTSGTDTTPATQAEGTADRWSNLIDDDGSTTGDSLNDELADADSPFVTGNPAFYNTILTTEGGTNVAPDARYSGATKVPNAGDWQLLSFFQFDAGTLDPFKDDPDDTPNILGRVSHAPTTGTLSLSVLNDPSATEISVNPIHDFCSPLFTKTMLLGRTPSGNLRYTTPAAGTTGIAGFSYGLRDADGDGLENAFDTCPFTANTGDSDGDGIDNSCDSGAQTGPPVLTAAGTDVDSDGYANRQDNCPQVPNGGPNGTVTGDPKQLDSESGETYKDAAPDGGPQTDSIGDVCDPSSLTSDGQGAFEQAYTFIAKCIGGGDSDGDGYCSGQDLDDGNSGIGGFTKNPGMDMEYTATNGHGDGAGGNAELWIGTDPLVPCGFTIGAPGQSENWPFDLVESNSINISDVLALKPVFGTAITTVAGARFDLVPSMSINISDVLALKPVFGTSCFITT